MAIHERKVKGDFGRISGGLHRYIMDSGMSVNLVGESRFSSGDTQVAVRVYDKYYARNKSRASLTLTVAGGKEEVFVSAIGAGGGSGVIFNFSLGAEGDFVQVVKDGMRQMGY